jgi:acyl-CoA synthetase (AMP-forming)/AMP-acid ligase II
MRLDFVGRRGASTALIDSADGSALSYDELDDLVQQRRVQLTDGTGVALLLCQNTIATVIDYLAALAAGYSVMPLDAAIASEPLDGILAGYRPEWILGTDSTRNFLGYDATQGDSAQRRTASDAFDVCGDLAILLSTSGSTGSPRMVRLSESNVNANTRSIISSLSITEHDRALTSMPLHYSYGLSVLNSHLAAGASVVISSASVIDPLFWSAIADHSVTTFAGVPYTFAMLKKLKYSPAKTPSITKITQAGGKLDVESVSELQSLCAANEVEFFIMYGQTEAGPRISCLPSSRLHEKLASAGLSMSGGDLFIDEVDSDLPAGTRGEIVYRGPNVMLGYASVREDLTGEDVANGVLRTGDLGYIDPDGFLFVTGRIKRIAKLFGTRVSLDEVEALMAGLGVVAAVGGNDKLHIHHQCTDSEAITSARKSLSRTLKAPSAAIVMHFDSEFPVMPSGKVDYRSLTERHTAGQVS